MFCKDPFVTSAIKTNKQTKPPFLHMLGLYRFTSLYLIYLPSKFSFLPSDNVCAAIMKSFPCPIEYLDQQDLHLLERAEE